MRLSWLFFIFFTTVLSAQTVHRNAYFGIELRSDTSWTTFAAAEKDSSYSDLLNQWIVGGYYDWILPLINKNRELTPDENDFSVVAFRLRSIRSLDDLIAYETARMEGVVSIKALPNPEEASYLFEIENNGKNLLVKKVFFYKNKVGYIVNYFALPEHYSINLDKFDSFVKTIQFFVPEEDYSQWDQRIEKDPLDATNYFHRAAEKMNFLQFESVVDDCTKALDLFPFYGEAFSLRGIAHLELGDTVMACNDFSGALREDNYQTESLFIELCSGVEKPNEIEDNIFANFDKHADHLKYVDSVKLHNSIILSLGGELNQTEKKMMNDINHLFHLTFEQLDSLYAADEGLIKLYAFGIICIKFPDQISEEHLEILKSKEETNLYKRNAQPFPTQPTKDIAAKMYATIEDRKKEKELQITVEERVNEFMRNYSTYPLTYEPISFDGFHTYSNYDPETEETEEESLVHAITVTYRLKDNSGNMCEQINTIKIDHNMNIMIIEEEESDTVSSYPPRIKEWLDKFGRKLSKKDKQHLKLN